MKKTVAIITNYFPPEMGAASNRIFHLAQSLEERGHSISVITPLPNYPEGRVFKNFQGEIYSKKVVDNIKVNRLWLLPSKSKNKFWRVFSILSYCFSLSLYFLFKKLPETVIIQSPPLFVAFTSLFWLRSKKRNLILNVSDLWPLAGKELKAIKSKKGLRLLERMEAFNYEKADIVLGQSEEILKHVSIIKPEKPTMLYRNYPRISFQNPTNTEKSGKKTMVYAGLLGVAQGIASLIQNIDYSYLEFHIYGSGPEETEIRKLITKNPDWDIHFHGSFSRELLHKEIVTYDFAIVPLVNRIYGSVPSKIFEYAHLGLPIIYFAGGEGGDLVSKHNLGWVVEPSNYEALNTLIKQLEKSEFSNLKRLEIITTAQHNFDGKQQIEALEKFL